MKKTILLSLSAIAVITLIAADIRVTLPTLTPRQKDGLDWAMNTNNSGTTNVFTNRQEYINRIVEPGISNQVLVSWETVLESYAQQRDNQEGQKTNKVAVLKNIRELLPSADTNKLAQIQAILNAP